MTIPYQSPDFTLDIEVPDPTRFSLEHWLYLTRSAGAPEVPVELAPLPLPLRTDEQLRRTLNEWGLIDEGGAPIPALAEMMRSLTEYDTALYGHTRFPLRAHTRTVDPPQGAEEWGLGGERVVVPRVPFLITVSDEVIVAATSDDDGLVVERFEGRTGTAGDLAAVLWDVIDPERAWPVRKMDTVRVPAEMLTDLEESGYGRLGGDADDENDETGASEERKRALVSMAPDHRIGTDTAMRLAEIIAAQPAAITQFTAVVPGTSGARTAAGAAASIIFTAGDDPSAVIGYPHRDIAGYQTAVYEGADDVSTTKAVASLLAEAKNPATDTPDQVG